ncbi:MAG: transcription termination factor NusA [candidate division WOR-3 bacterium]
MNKEREREIIEAIKEISAVKNIDKSKLLKIVEESLKFAVQKHYGEDGDYKVTINEATGEIKIERGLVIVENVEEPNLEISLEDAIESAPDEKSRKNAKLGDKFWEELSVEDVGRSAINRMKQLINTKVLAEERESLFNEFSAKVGMLVNGHIKKIDKAKGFVYVNLARLDAKMAFDEAIPDEIKNFRQGKLLKAVIIEVKKNNNKDPEIFLSRKSDEFLKKLLEFEVPEIEDESVVIKGIAREPGKRSKIAVMSVDDKIDPVGACVGVKGSRIHTIIRELNNEHIDIIQWSSDPTLYTQRAISPGVIIRAFKNEEMKTMKLVVKDDTKDKAIGKDGVNLKLASRLTGWNLQVISESEFKEELGKSSDINPIYELKDITENQKENLVKAGYKSVEEIVEKGIEELENIQGFGKKTAEKIMKSAKDYLKERESNNA